MGVKFLIVIRSVFALLLMSKGVSGDCFPEVEFAERILLVVPKSSVSSEARLEVIERDKWSGNWLPNGPEKRAVLGRRGIAWAFSYAVYAMHSEKLKVEGDGKTPAGLFLVGEPFGFSQSNLPGYVKLRAERHFCVNDPNSLQYNQVVPKSSVALGTGGENMPTQPLYRRGLFINYPTNRKSRGGSCIFIHVWRSAASGTLGCIALEETDVADLQNLSAGNKVIVAILPETEAEALRHCIYAR